MGDEGTAGGADVPFPVRHPSRRGRRGVGHRKVPVLQCGGEGARRHAPAAAAPTEVDSGRVLAATTSLRRRALALAALHSHLIRAAAEQT